MIQVKIAKELLFIGFLVFMTVFSSCRESPRRVSGTSHIRLTDTKLIDYNRGIVKSEEQEIENFLNRYRWDMKKSTTGLRYLIYQMGNGIQAKEGMLVRFQYSVKLLNGKLAYSSDSLGPKSFILGHGGVETGLEEGMLLLRQGDRAKFIIPSYLAFGLLGDQQKIPPGATLVYDVDILDLETIK